MTRSKRTRGTPRPWTLRVHQGRSPGLRVVASVRPSRRATAPVAWGTAARRLQLRGQRRNGWFPIAPASLFASSSWTIRKNPDGRKVARSRGRCQRRKGVVDRNDFGTEPNRRLRVQAPFTADRVGQSRYILAYLTSEWTCPCLPVLLQQPAIAAKECRFHAPLSQAGYGYIVRCSSPTNRWAPARALWSLRRTIAEGANDAVPRRGVARIIPPALRLPPEPPTLLENRKRR